MMDTFNNKTNQGPLIVLSGSVRLPRAPDERSLQSIIACEENIFLKVLGNEKLIH